MPDAAAPAARALLPHTGPARLLEDVVRVAPGFVEAVGRVPRDHPFARDGQAPAFLGLELGAQAAAALEALGRAGDAGLAGARIGHLVRVRRATFARATLPVETPLRVIAECVGSAAPLAVYSVRVDIDGAECLRATLGTHVGPDARRNYEHERETL